MKPGLEKALTEIGLVSDRLADVTEERTRIMKEKYGIDYHDSDYVDVNGKQISKTLLTDEQKTNRKIASTEVPSKTAQMKFQDLFRDKIREVMIERGIPIENLEKSNREHENKRQFSETMEIKAANKLAKEEQQLLQENIEFLKAEKDELSEQIESQNKTIEDNESAIKATEADIKLLDEKKTSMSAWNKKSGSEKEFFKLIDENVKEQSRLMGEPVVVIPKSFWKELREFVKSFFKLRKENQSLKESVSYKKVKEADLIISKRDDIIKSAKTETDSIVVAAETDARSIRTQMPLAKENQELRQQLSVYKSMENENLEFKTEVERRKMKKRVGDKKNRVGMNL